MVVEVGDQPIAGLGARALPVGDVVESISGLAEFAGKGGQFGTGVLREFGRSPARHGVEHTVFFKLAGHRSQPMADGGGPITSRRILFGGCPMLCGAEFV